MTTRRQELKGNIEQQPFRDPFYDIKPDRVWLDVTNIGVNAEGMVKVILSINGHRNELFHSYVTDGVVSHCYNLSWLVHRPWWKRIWRHIKRVWRNG